MLIAPDVSEFQYPLDATYPRTAVIFRAAFGTWKMDDEFVTNAAEAKALWDAGTLRGGAVIYQPWLTDATPQETFDYLWKLIGPAVPDWLTGILGDVEAWPGTSYAIRGDRSPRFNTLYGLNAHRMGSWLGCKGYGNWGDLCALWGKRDPRCEFVEANYGTQIPTRVGKIGQQYTDGSAKYPRPTGLPTATQPFGACDHNVFPAINDPAAFRRAWGRPTWAELHTATKPTPTTVKPPATKPAPAPHYNVKRGSSLVTPTGDRAIFLSDNGLEVRHNGAHEAWIWRPTNG